MKRLLKGIAVWKSWASLFYTASMVIFLLLCEISNCREVTVTQLWTLLLACVIASLAQAVCFSDWIIKKMRYTWRSLLFVVLLFPALSFLAWRFRWFPTEEAGGWLEFTVIFFVIYAVSTIGYDIYFRLTGRKYDGLLGQYRREREEKKEDS